MRYCLRTGENIANWSYGQVVRSLTGELPRHYWVLLRDISGFLHIRVCAEIHDACKHETVSVCGIVVYLKG